MTTRIITLPYEWSGAMSNAWTSSPKPSDYFNMVGWRYSSAPEYTPEKYNIFLKFNYAAMIGKRMSKVVSATLKIQSYVYDTTVNTTIHEVLKPATNNGTWLTYDGNNNWNTPGAFGANVDYNPSQLAAVSFPNIAYVWNSIPLSISGLSSVFTNNHALIIFPPATMPESYGRNSLYLNWDTHKPYIEIEYKSSATTGDATIF